MIDRDGTIYQLVPRSIMCRHTVGLNYTAIGIEHVGSSDGEILRNAQQMAASLRLTRWLRCRYGIGVNNVIGHSESLLLAVPPRARRAAQERRRTATGRAPSMRTYRAKLVADAAPAEYVGRMRIVAAVSLLLIASVAADAADAAPQAAAEGLRLLQGARRLRARRRAAHAGRRRRGRPRGAAAGDDDRDAAADAAPPVDVGGDRAADAPRPCRRAATDVGGTVPDFSGTNTQELDVDEPDVIKTDGRRIFAVTDRTLRVIDVAERRR